MGPVLDKVFVAVLLSGLGAWITWGWLSWARDRPKDLRFGVLCSLAGFSFASLSASLQISSGLYAQFIGGFPFMDRTLLRIYGSEFVLALLALLLSLCGAASKTPLRWKAPTLSAFMLLLVIAQAAGE